MSKTKSRSLSLSQRGMNFETLMWLFTRLSALGMYALIIFGLIGALIMGSSLIITTKIEPHLFGYPALGIVGYVLSAVLGLYVIWDIFRHGRHK